MSSKKNTIKDAESNTADGVPEIKYPSVWDTKSLDFSDNAKVRKEKVVMRDTKTGQIYGSRVVFQRATESHLIPELMALRENDESNGNDDPEFPDIVMGELKSNIRKGARDLEQKWANALELTHKAFEVANVARPTPDEDRKWRQYQDLISFSVKQLAATRGASGDWRMTAYSLHK